MRKKNLYEPGSTTPFALSRSKLEAFVNCPRCFYLDRRLGVAPPSGPPFSINSAVDHLLKKEFDVYRGTRQPHPLMKAAGLEAIPYQHESLSQWRENFKGVRYFHEVTGFEVFGAIDDLWIDLNTNDLLVVDYKATAKDGEVNIDAEWQHGYKRQMELYQWLLRKNGFSVSNTGYFVYCNGDKTATQFDGTLYFKIKLIPYQGSDTWVDSRLAAAKQCLDGALPDFGADCEQCKYAGDLSKVVPFAPPGEKEKGN
jgi:hypothetical protein